jgi:membrane protease YdiL (CAAX protease family)
MTLPLVFAATVVAVVLLWMFGDVDDEAATIGAATIAQTAVFIVWPLALARTLGTGYPRRDLGLYVDLPTDVGYGVAGALVGLIGGGALAAGIAALLNVNVDDAGNTGVLDDVEGTAWAPIMIVMIVVLVPISEELMFRGLVMRSIQRRWGRAWGLWGGALVFTLPHFAGGNPAETLVLYSQVFVYGVVLGYMAQRFDRLGPSIIAHMCVNSMVIILAT